MAVNRFQPPGGKPTAEALAQISQVFDDNNPIASFPVSSASFLQVAAGAVQRCAPRAAGMNVVIPAATGANFNQTITLFVENALGSLRVRAASGTIDGALSISLGAGITTCLILRSNGVSGWVTERASGFPAAGNALSYTGETLNYVGSSSSLTLIGITGNQGTVDISTLHAGGSLFVSAPTGDWTIEGFSGNTTAGFWFNILVGNSSFIGTLANEAAAPTAANRLRASNFVDVVGTRIQAIVFYGGVGSRWSVVSAPTIPAGRLLARTVYITGSAATHNLQAATTRFIVKLQAGGSGGTGTAISTATNIAAGTPGAAGSYAERTFNVVAGVTSGTYTVGAAGAAGNNAGAASGAGGNTSFTYNAVAATALGGPASANVLANGLSLLTALGAAAPGVSTNCDLATTAPGGEPTVRLSGTVCWTGKGGSSSFGNGGDPRITAGAGVAATGLGSGGGAGLSINASAAVTGGAGTGGFIIVEEYS